MKSAIVARLSEGCARSLNHSVPWWKAATINILCCVSLPSLITRKDLANQSSHAIFLWSILVPALNAFWIVAATADGAPRRCDLLRLERVGR